MAPVFVLPSPKPAPPVLGPLPAYDARDLVGGGTQATLLLDGQAYTLRVTRAGKLILTK